MDKAHSPVSAVSCLSPLVRWTSLPQSLQTIPPLNRNIMMFKGDDFPWLPISKKSLPNTLICWWR